MAQKPYLSVYITLQLIQGKPPPLLSAHGGSPESNSLGKTIMLESTKHYSRLENSNSELSTISETTIISNIPKKK